MSLPITNFISFLVPLQLKVVGYMTSHFFLSTLKFIKSTKHIAECVANIESYLAVKTKLKSGIK